MALLSIVLFTQLVCVIEALILPCDFFENREFSETIRCCVVRNTSKSAREENTYYCMPRFMIIGTQKSGTTALAGFLSQHPMVFFPSEKEVHFFDKNASTPSTNVTSDRDSSSTVSLLAYMKHFRITEATAARAVGVMPHHQPLEEGQKFPFADVGSTSLNESAMSEQPVLLQEYAESSESGVLQSTVDREPAIPPRRRSRHRKVQATPSPQLGAGANAAGNTAEQLFFGDATPFYMASRLSCQRIAKMFPGSSVHAAALVSAPPMTVNNMINDTDRRDSTTNLLYQPTASTNSLASASPAMKFITILRDPIERLYSEYHMKRRRVEDQEIFLRALSRFGGDLQRCLRQFEANYLPSTVASLNASVSCGNDSKTDDQEHNSTTSANLGNCAADHSDRTVSMTLEELPAVVKVPKLAKNTAFMECLPLLLTGHKSFPLTRLLQQLDKLYSYNSSAYIGRTSSHLGSRSGNRSSSSSSLSGHKHDHRGFAFAALSTELTPAEFCFDSTLEEDSASPSGRASPVATDSLDISHVHTGGGVGEKDSVSETTLTAARAAEEMATLGIVVDAPPAPTASAPTVFLQRKKCNLKFGNEHVGSSIEMVLQEELDSLVSCGAEHGLDILKGNISSVDAVVAKCMRVRKGIADQYLYRSMYAVQLHHCWKTLDRRSFLILRAEDLRMKQKETVQRVLNFIGVDTSSSSYENGSANVTVDANATAVTVDVDQLKDSIIQEDSTSSSSSSSFGSGSNLNSGAAEIGGINSPSMVMCTRGNCPDENSLAEAVDAVLLSRRTDTAEQQNALTTAVKLSNGDVNVNVSTRINNTTSAGGNTEGEDEGGIMKSGFVNNATSDLQNRITQIFPEFAATSGWRLHSDYPPLSDTLRSHLYETVFRHHEQLLKELLSAVPPADDVV